MRAIGAELQRRTGLAPVVIGTPEPALDIGWREELDAALPALLGGAGAHRRGASRRRPSIAATSRCAVSLATLPAVARHHPEACVVWFDSTPTSTPAESTTGYLGGLALAGPAGLWDLASAPASGSTGSCWSASATSTASRKS